jgi:5-oxoprolinase (ATP-hydrolysing) subunit C
MAIVIIKTGPLMTVQDLGRPGWGRFGISPSGAMDPLAAQAANTLVGNAAQSPLLEITGPGGEIQLEGARLVAVCGADLGAVTGAGVTVEPFSRLALDAGQRIRFAARRRGARAYLAVAGGLDVARPFGSAASDLAGGVGGGPLRPRDRLALGPAAPAPDGASGAGLLGWYDPAGELRFIPAPRADARALAALAGASFTVSSRSNRTGYRLDGPPVPSSGRGDELSEPVAPGTIQLPPEGGPILLMADRQTVGGYPALGHLARADAPKAAQLWPGDPVRFVPVSVEEAQAALRAQVADLRRAGGGPLRP